ncbi:DUF4406 domain-containing protein [Paenarthrobacter sp. NPDC089714]|uniref:DUF4406 domain-containing protein n=1 Tax=Paenarthrobacter sp. NPDC089714 TaxID=3364377 RepID=UPI0038128642
MTEVLEAPALPRVLYLAGPMSGLPAFNYPSFDAAAKQLREAGFEVLNPAENSAPEGAEWVDYMKLAIGQLAQADAVAFLAGAGNSKGARIEMRLAVDLEMRVRPVRAWLTEAGQSAYMSRLLNNETKEASK